MHQPILAYQITSFFCYVINGVNEATLRSPVGIQISASIDGMVQRRDFQVDVHSNLFLVSGDEIWSILSPVVVSILSWARILSVCLPNLESLMHKLLHQV